MNSIPEGPRWSDQVGQRLAFEDERRMKNNNNKKTHNTQEKTRTGKKSTGLLKVSTRAPQQRQQDRQRERPGGEAAKGLAMRVKANPLLRPLSPAKGKEEGGG